MAKKVLLVFAIISLVLGAVSLTVFGIIFAITFALQRQFPGTTLGQGGVIVFYSSLIVGVILVVVSIILFIIRAKVKA